MLIITWILINSITNSPALIDDDFEKSPTFRIFFFLFFFIIVKSPRVDLNEIAPKQNLFSFQFEFITI